MIEQNQNKPNTNKRPNYRRRQAGALITAVALGVAGKAGAESLIGNSNDEGVGTPEPARVYTVKTGDNMWGIFEKAKLDGDPREFTYELGETLPDDASHQGSLLQPGDQILLPAESAIGKKTMASPEVETPTYVQPKDGVQGDNPPSLP